MPDRRRRPARRREKPEPPEPPGPIQALETATRFLSTRPRTRWEVERRLARAQAPPDVIEATVQRLVELHFIDDLAFSRWLLEQRDRHAPRGLRVIEAELRQHGVGRDVIELLRDEVAEAAQGAEAGLVGEETTPRTEDERARSALVQHLRGRPIPEDRPALKRLGSFLVRRGFSPDTARSAIRAERDEALETD